MTRLGLFNHMEGPLIRGPNTIGVEELALMTRVGVLCPGWSQAESGWALAQWWSSETWLRFHCGISTTTSQVPSGTV